MKTTSNVRRIINKRRNINYSDVHINYNILAMIIILLVLSCIVVYSTSYQNSFISGFLELLDGDTALYDLDTNNILMSATSIKKHIFNIMIGILLMLIVIKIPNKYIKKVSVIYYGISAVAVLLVPILGRSVKGQKRWLSIFGIMMQPSDFYKVGLILLLAVVLYYADRKMLKSRNFWLYLAAAILPFTLIVMYSDLSTGLVLVAIIFIIIIVTVRDAKPLILSSIIGGVISVILLIATVGYRMQRIVGWLNLEGSKEGYQTLQGLYAIASGGLFGKGIGNSIMKNTVPEAGNDFVFTIICEEFGIIGGILLLAFFALLIREIYRLALRTNNIFYFTILIGCITHISVQIFINIGVTLNLIPNTGIGLPFLSTGGSSIISFLFELGIILRISRLIAVEELIRNKEKI